jgi:hypothetical protein
VLVDAVISRIDDRNLMVARKPAYSLCLRFIVFSAWFHSMHALSGAIGGTDATRRSYNKHEQQELTAAKFVPFETCLANKFLALSH